MLYNRSMLDFHQKRKLKNISLLPITRVFLFVLVIIVAYSAFIRYQIANEMTERRDLAESEIGELRKQKQQLEEKVEYLSDDRGIEAEMRRQFDIALPGEEVVVILEDESVVEPLGTGTTETEETPWYKFW